MNNIAKFEKFMRTHSTFSQAERIAHKFDNDGSRYPEDLADELNTQGRGVRKPSNANIIQWTFLDGSVITTAYDQWDIGYPGCFCWQSVGHTGECKNG